MKSTIETGQSLNNTLISSLVPLPALSPIVLCTSDDSHAIMLSVPDGVDTTCPSCHPVCCEPSRMRRISGGLELFREQQRGLGLLLLLHALEGLWQWRAKQRHSSMRCCNARPAHCARKRRTPHACALRTYLRYAWASVEKAYQGHSYCRLWWC